MGEGRGEGGCCLTRFDKGSTVDPGIIKRGVGFVYFGPKEKKGWALD